jgi:phytoene dehydrogenase-like protein
MGGEIFYNARIQKILVEDLPGGKGSQAVGVRLADGSEQRADIVISAADGRATIFDMLDGRFISDKLQTMYEKGKIFQPLVFIGLGVNRTFDDFPALTSGVSVLLDEPIMVADKQVKRLEYMVYNFDPSLAPAGKTVITCMIITNYSYWKELSSDSERYEAEKERIGLEVIKRLDQRFPGIAGQVEMADVATPLTFEHYTGNWQGSFEGWLPTPELMMERPSYTLPNLENFYMVGQWVQPGGGLPSGVMTGRAVVQTLCKKEKKKFKTVR